MPTRTRCRGYKKLTLMHQQHPASLVSQRGQQGDVDGCHASGNHINRDSCPACLAGELLKEGLPLLCCVSIFRPQLTVYARKGHKPWALQSNCWVTQGWYCSPVTSAIHHRHRIVPGQGTQLEPCRRLLGEKPHGKEPLCTKPAPCSALASWTQPCALVLATSIRQYTDSTRGAESANVTRQLAHLANGARCQHDDVLTALNARGAICILLHRGGRWPMSHT